MHRLKVAKAIKIFEKIKYLEKLLKFFDESNLISSLRTSSDDITINNYWIPTEYICNETWKILCDRAAKKIKDELTEFKKQLEKL